MKKIEFVHLKKHDFRNVSATEDKYMILSYFIGHYRFTSDIDNIISRLEKVRAGEKRFDEIQHPNVYWSFGASSGYLNAIGILLISNRLMIQTWSH